MQKKYDIIVVGAGHAGCEAALASARIGAKVLLITSNLDRVAWASCNPAIGGPGKSQLVREVDALGGEMAINSDKAFIQMKVLNLSRGPAVWAMRSQIDKIEYSYKMKEVLEDTENLDLLNAEVLELIWDIQQTKREKNHQSKKIQKEDQVGKIVRGVKVDYGIDFFAKAVILTTGTFLRGKILAGKWEQKAGRAGDTPANSLTKSLKGLGLKIGRLKTGTPPRIDGSTIDYSKALVQPGSEKPVWFSFENEWKNQNLDKYPIKQIDCHLIYTNSKTHNLILSKKDQIPLFDGTIESVGPRYCPSFEAKVVNFPDKSRHPFFIEPEGRHTNEVYIQGANTSVPVDLQEEFIHSIPALRDAKIVRFGYAVEYDFVFPTQLSASLELKSVKNLFLAGQLNGTTGYEEAAAQGLVAGINATRKYVQNLDPIIFKRTESYIGVLIDDLVTQDYKEPYRMFTARSKFRLKLRQDNADLRLSQLGFDIGLLPKNRLKIMKKKRKMIDKTINFLYETKVFDEGHEEKVSLALIAKRGKSLKEIEREYGVKILTGINSVDNEVWVGVYYEGYLKKEEDFAKKLEKIDNIKIPEDFDYDAVTSIRTEARNRLKEVSPETLGQASRLTGVMNSDVSVLMIFLKKWRGQK